MLRCKASKRSHTRSCRGEGHASIAKPFGSAIGTVVLFLAHSSSSEEYAASPRPATAGVGEVEVLAVLVVVAGARDSALVVKPFLVSVGGSDGGSEGFLGAVGGSPGGTAPCSFSAVEVRRTLTPPMILSLPFLRLRGPTVHDSDTSGAAVSLPWLRAAFSASSCWRRKALSCSVVSFLTSFSFLRVLSITSSRNATSSSSRLRNWFVSRFCSSKASCFAAQSPDSSAVSVTQIQLIARSKSPLFASSVSNRLFPPSCSPTRGFGWRVASIIFCAFSQASSRSVGSSLLPAETKREDMFVVVRCQIL